MWVCAFRLGLSVKINLSLFMCTICTWVYFWPCERCFKNPDANLLYFGVHPGANLHPGANCAHENGLSLFLYAQAKGADPHQSNPLKRAYQLAASVWGWEGLVGLRQVID